MLRLRYSCYVLLCGCLATPAVPADDWPQWRGANRDGVWSEDGVYREFPADKLDPEWSVNIGPGYSGPTVADDRVYVTDRVASPEQQERVLCFDAGSGHPLWDFVYPCPYRGIGYTAGPRASVTVDDKRAYALGAMGHLHCLDAGAGALLWKRDLNRDFQIQQRMPEWGIAASPLVIGDLVVLQIGGSDGACIVALDKKSGEDVWHALNDRASYSAPIVVRQAGEDVIVCWTGDSVAGLRPADGHVHWRIPFAPRNMPIGIATPIVNGNRLFVTSFYDGALMLQLDPDRFQATQLWHRVGRNEQDTDGLHSIISTPLFMDDHIYGVDSYGEFRCLRAEDGQRLWEDQTLTPRARWSNIHMVQHGRQTWMFNERGQLIITELSPQGVREISRTHLIEPTTQQLSRREGVCWAHPAFADRHVFIRNDNRLISVSLER